MEPTPDDFDISAMYDKSRRLRTSAEIVKEARMSVALTGDRGGAKMVASTRRPETPAHGNGRWPRRHASTRLLPMVSEMMPLTSRSSNSIQSEPESPWQRLSPLPERSQSVCESTEKRGTSSRLLLRRRRPLSMITTSVKCDEAFLNLRHDIESRKLVPQLPELSQWGLGGTKYGVSSSLPSLPMSTRTLESGYDSRLSSASIDEIGSADDDKSPRMNENVHMHLKQLTSFTVNGSRPDEELDAWMESFHACLSSGKCFTKRSQTRTLILQSLFRALDEAKPKLTVRVLAIILAMNVSGHNLINVCKSTYALCGNAENHIWFHHDMFLEHFVASIKRLSLSDSTSMLYVVCTLDILATNDPIRRQLLELPMFESMSHVLQLLITRSSQAIQQNQVPTTAIVIPALSSIRTLLDGGRSAKQALMRHEMLPQLVFLMNAYSEESEVVLYGMRTLSKLSLSEDCCEQLVNTEPDFFLCSANWLRLYAKNQDIVVRLLFILGNLLSVIERAQWQLFQAPGIVASFQDIFEHFLNFRHLVRQEKVNDSSPLSEDNVSVSDSGTERSESIRTQQVADIEDVLVKLARVIANLSVHSGIGSTLCQNEKLLNHLCSVLETARDPEDSTSDELIINALVALHNLSFYHANDGLASEFQDRLGEAVLAVIHSSSTVHCVSEACSLLANLTRDVQFCDWIVQKQVHEQLISFLTLTSSMQLTKSAAGALINVSRCKQYRETLLKGGLLYKAFELLKRSVANYNWYLASLAIQIICNLIRVTDDDQTNGKLWLNSIDRSLLREVADLLLEHTDDSTLTSPNELQDSELISQLHQLWEQEFCFASTELLETLDIVVRTCNDSPI